MVHLCGAVCAAMGAWLMGARAGRFRAGEAVSGLPKIMQSFTIFASASQFHIYLLWVNVCLA